MFWKTGKSDIKVVAVVFLDMSDEIDSMNKTTFDRLPDVFPGWWVPSESQNIATSMLLGGLGTENTCYPQRGRLNQGYHAPQELCQFFLAAC